MFNFPLTKSSQQHKTARQYTAKLRWKAILSVLDPTRFCANRDCLLKLRMLGKSAGTVSRELHWEKRVYIGLTSYG